MDQDVPSVTCQNCGVSKPTTDLLCETCAAAFVAHIDLRRMLAHALACEQCELELNTAIFNGYQVARGPDHDRRRT